MLKTQGRRRGRDSFGFTLLEVVVALSVLAVIMTPLTMAIYTSTRTVNQAENDLSQSNDARRLLAYFNKDAQTVARDGVDAHAGCGTGGTHLVSFAWDLETGITHQASYVVLGQGRASKVLRRYCTDDDPDVTETVIMDAFGVDGKDAHELIHGPDSDDPTRICGPDSCTIVVDGAYKYTHEVTRRVPGEGGGSKLFVPPAPAKPVAYGRNGYVTASWSAPALNSMQPPITGYNVYLYTESSTVPALSATTSELDLFWRVDERPLGSRWYFRVEAFNDIGVGQLSEASDVVESQPTTPDPVRSVTVEELDESFLVSWVPPENDGGHAITGYIVTARSLATSSDTVVTVNDPNQLSVMVPGLQNGVEYIVTVQAVSSFGQGELSEPVPGKIPYGPAVPPETVRSKAQPSAVWLQWERDPDAGNGREIVAYQVELYVGAGGGSLHSSPELSLSELGCAGSSTTCEATITAPNGELFRANVVPIVEVRAGVRAAGGESSLSEPVAGEAKTPPHVRPSDKPSVVSPITLTATGGADLEATWKVPATNGEPMVAYQVQSRTALPGSGSFGGWTIGTEHLSTVDEGGTIKTVLTGTSGRDHQVRIRVANTADWAQNTKRWGDWSPPSDTRVIVGAPTVPRSVSLTRPNGSFGRELTLSWTAPDSNGGAPVTYSYTCTSSGAPTVSGTRASDGSVLLAGFKDGRSYSCTVTASNGAGTASAVSNLNESFGECTLKNWDSPYQNLYIDKNATGQTRIEDIAEFRRDDNHEKWVFYKFDIRDGKCEDINRPISSVGSNVHIDSTVFRAFRKQSSHSNLNLCAALSAYPQYKSPDGWIDSGNDRVTWTNSATHTSFYPDRTVATFRVTDSDLTVTSAAMRDRVAQWYADPSTNWGWVLTDTRGSCSGRSGDWIYLHSSRATDSSKHPRMEIKFLSDGQ